jgi:RNA 3'-phosphate cyclase
MPTRSLTIDGAYGEGGGQLVRTAVALAAITGTRMHLQSIRAARSPPGLAPQHLAAVRAVAALCGARCDGLELRATDFDFAPVRLIGGDFDFDIGTAGSITLVLQALLPVMMHAPERCTVRVVGGTDVRAAPPIDYFMHVLLPLLARMGLKAACTVQRRGYYPRGGGEIHLAVAPAQLRPLALTAPGPLLAVGGLAHVANLASHIADRMRESALRLLQEIDVPVLIESVLLQEHEAIGHGGAIVLWARAQYSVLGAARVAERGVPAETLGDSAASDLLADLKSEASLDMHATDQMLVHAALAGPGSAFTARAISLHAQTAMWLIEQFLPVRFRISDLAGLKRIDVTSGNST